MNQLNKLVANNQPIPTRVLGRALASVDIAEHKKICDWLYDHGYSCGLADKRGRVFLGKYEHREAVNGL